MIALTIVGYWIGLGLFIALLMYAALQFAKFCEYIVDKLS